MRPGTTFVQGKDQATARVLLNAADKVGLPAYVVKTAAHGFIVPDAVWDAVENTPNPTPIEPF